MNNDEWNVGDDSVVIGNVSHRNVGSRSVVIGATDANGNTIIDKPMAVGYGAKAGPGSIAIGAYAGAGSDLFLLLNQVVEILKEDPVASENISLLISELKKESPDTSLIRNLWYAVEAAVTTGGAFDLAIRIKTLLGF